MEKTLRNIWYHSKLYGVNTYYNGETNEVISKSIFGDFILKCYFTINNILYLLFDLSFISEEGFEVTIINREITDKDWNKIQKVMEFLNEEV